MLPRACWCGGQCCLFLLRCFACRCNRVLRQARQCCTIPREAILRGGRRQRCARYLPEPPQLKPGHSSAEVSPFGPYGQPKICTCSVSGEPRDRAHVAVGSRSDHVVCLQSKQLARTATGETHHAEGLVDTFMKAWKNNVKDPLKYYYDYKLRYGMPPRAAAAPGAVRPAGRRHADLATRTGPLSSSHRAQPRACSSR